MTIRVCLLDGTGCGGCALEAEAALALYQGAARRGIRPVESPLHADVLLLCGPLRMPLAEYVQQIESSMLQPWVRLQIGDCGDEESEAAILRGCPPAPEAILEAIVEAWRRRPRRGREGRP